MLFIWEEKQESNWHLVTRGSCLVVDWHGDREYVRSSRRTDQLDPNTSSTQNHGQLYYSGQIWAFGRPKWWVHLFKRWVWCLTIDKIPINSSLHSTQIYGSIRPRVSASILLVQAFFQFAENPYLNLNTKNSRFQIFRIAIQSISVGQIVDSDSQEHFEQDVITCNCKHQLSMCNSPLIALFTTRKYMDWLGLNSMHPLLLQDFFWLRHLKLNKAKKSRFLGKSHWRFKY